MGRDISIPPGGVTPGKQLPAPQGKGEKEKNMKSYKEDGIIVKPFEYTFFAPWNNEYQSGKMAIVLDINSWTIDIDPISGAAPLAGDVVLFLLADEDVRIMIKKYQKFGGRKHPFKMRTASRFSGGDDIYINFYNERGIQIGGKKLMHISQYGKLNYGWYKMYVGDFVEIVAHIKGTTGERRKSIEAKELRRRSNCRYCKVYWDEDGSASTDISKIL